MQLGFLCFEVSDLGAWHTFLTETLGLTDAGGQRYRMDGHAWRIQLTEGPLDDLLTVGWELDTPEALRARLGALRAADIEVKEADPTARGATHRFTCTDPAGIPVELVCGLERASAPFVSPVVQGGFVADALGLGHLVLSAPDPAESARFYADLLGFRLSDRIQTTFYGHAVDLAFYHANPRHHSLAFGGPQRKRVNHFLLEVKHLDEVGLAYDRCIRAGRRIMLTLGRHPNDRMLSFYAMTPSRFQFELGWGGRQVDPDTHDGDEVYTQISEWGHHPPQAVFPPPRRKG